MKKSSRMMGAVVTAAFLACAAACSSSASGSNPPGAATSSMPSMSGGASAPASSADTITISNFAFGVPKSVAPGATITVTNKDSVEHTVTADSGNVFDVTIPAGGTASFKAPTTAGSYPFHCTVHPFMKATLVVSGS